MATKVVDLMYWRDIRKTGVVFTGLVVGLASLFQVSAITMIANVCLTIMCLTFPLRLYYKLLELLRWNPNSEHPFQSYLDEDSTLTDGETVLLVEDVVLRIAFALTEIKRLLFIGSVVDSIKFIVLLYLLTYVGLQTNGLTLVIVAVIFMFSLPLLYKKQQVRIRRMFRAARNFLKKIRKMITKMYNMIPSTAPAPTPAPTSAPAPAPAAKPKQKSK